ncbi:MAG: alanine dehydrogenase [Bacteroidetes bacterium]|nr:MAG: alanine dehydrogenase [Bacteroidota bacterium]
MAENKPFVQFSSSSSLLPQEEMLEVSKRSRKLTIGIPRELSANENRIGLVPSAIKLLTNQGHRILVEQNAGEKARFSDHEYAEAGAEIIDNHATVFESDIVLKIAPPLREEIDLLDKRKCVMSVLQLPTRSKDYFQQLMAKKVNAIAFEHIQDKTGALPLVRSMSEIIGNATMLIAAEYLCHPNYGKGIMLGGFPGVPSTEVVIIGSGTVAEYASRAALGLGALVKVFDNSMYKLRTLQNNVGTRIYTSVFQPDEIEKALTTADVVIAAKHAPAGTSPCFIPAEMVRKMKPGSVIIDVSIDQGGCFETSRPTNHQNPVYQVHDITHYCVPNIASKVPRTASTSFSNFFSSILIEIAENGGVDATLKSNRAFSKGAYIFNGVLTNQQISKLHDIPFQHLDLLLAAFY